VQFFRVWEKNEKEEGNIGLFHVVYPAIFSFPVAFDWKASGLCSKISMILNPNAYPIKSSAIEINSTSDVTIQSGKTGDQFPSARREKSQSQSPRRNLLLVGCLENRR
jgi:hypothetical protein